MAKEDNIASLKQRIVELETEKAQLLKLVSHDVKSPFNKLYALSNLLQLVSEDLNEEQLDYLSRMEWVIKEGLTVVRNLMDLRAIENNNIELSFEDLQVEYILNDIFKNYEKQTEAKNIVFKDQTTNVTTRSDKRILEKIIDNLVSNAVKFSAKESNIVVTLTENGGLIQLTITSKSGPISEEEVTSLFKRSSPLSTRPTHGESALGNGLFIAQHYAHALSGKITFSQKESEITFKLELQKYN